MRKLVLQICLTCGLLFTFAAFPVFAQKNTQIREIEVNRKPFQDLSAFLTNKLARNEVDLSQQFKVILEGILDKNGRLDRQKSRFTVIEGNQQIAEIGRMAISAIDDSGSLAYLRNLGAEKVKITLAQDKDNTLVTVETEQITPERANAIRSSFNLYIEMAKSKVKRQDEKSILNASQSAVNGKVFMVSVILPKQIVRDMVIRALKLPGSKGE